MKKLIIILAFLPLFAAGQTNVRVSTERVGFWTITNDTRLITTADKVIHGSVYCPMESTDSVLITGCNVTVGGIVSNGILLPPGEAALNIGFDYAYTDTVRIIAQNKAWIMLLKKN
jgi:hypothetical protein